MIDEAPRQAIQNVGPLFHFAQKNTTPIRTDPPPIAMGQQVQTQLIGIGAAIALCGTVTFILLKLLDLTVGLRVSHEQETEGLDIGVHNETGYNF
jgi:ammonia channel protein AmtB